MTDDRRPAPSRPAAPPRPGAPLPGRPAAPPAHGVVITKVAPETRLAVSPGATDGDLAALLATLDPAAVTVLPDADGRVTLAIVGDAAAVRAALAPVADVEDVSDRFGTLRLGGAQAPLVLRRILRADVGAAPVRAAWGGIAVEARRDGDEVRLTVPIDRSADFLAAVMRISLPYGVKAVGERVHTGPTPR